MILQIKNVSHAFGPKKVLHNVNLDIEEGQIVAVVGPSGCGKSTLLRAILGTHLPQHGEILVNGMPVVRPNRNVGIVYQHYSLYDFMTAHHNVAFGLMLDQTSLPFRFFRPFAWKKLRKQHLEIAEKALDKVGLQTALNCYPSEMSGGMRQRAAIAQAIVMQPQVLLLDEPFGALDMANREECQYLLLNMYQENLAAKKEGRKPPHTVFFVTHELDEALYVSDRVVGLSQFHPDGVYGATVVYDKASPIFHPNDPREFGIFQDQKEELYNTVFDSEQIKRRSDCVSFWKDHQKYELRQQALLARVGEKSEEELEAEQAALKVEE